MARNNENGPSRVERALKTFADSLIARMEDASRDLTWNKGWTEGMSRYVGLPQNIKGQTYMGGQALFLQLHTSREGFSMPVYMTMKMADEYGAKINKGAKSTDVFKFGVRAYGEDGKRIPEAEYFKLSDEEKKKCKTSTYLRTFVEWNIDQTNFKEVQPDLYAKLEKKFQVGKLDQTQDTEGMYRNEALDKLIHEDGAWICPIKEASGSAAFYRPSVNEIQIPTKENFNIHPGNVQETFKDGQEYYSTALHEMAHSTGHESQLSREGITGSHKFGDAAYAKEELVAELTAAMVCNAMGFDKRITENSAAYLKDWASEMRKNPRYIVSVMADVNKASRMEIERIDVQRKALGMRPLMDGSLDGEQERVKNEQQLSEVEKAAQEEKKKKDTKLLSDAGLKDQKTYFCPLTLDVDNLGLGKLWDDGKNEEVINALKSAQQESGRSWGMEEVSSLGYELPREVLGEDEGYMYALGEDGHFVMAEKVQRETLLLELGKAEVTQEEKDFIKDENNEPMKTEEVNAKSLDGGQQEVAANKDGSEVFYAAADTVIQEYSEDFDAYRENGNKAVMLNTARDWMRQFDVDVKQWQFLEPSEVSKLNIIAEDDKTAVAYYENSGNYDILPKFTRQEILDDIKSSGLDENASSVVKGIAYEDIARQFSELDSSSQIVFPNDEYLDYKYNKDTNKIELGHYMNAGMAVDHEFDYDTSLTLRENMEIVTEELMKLPQYQKQEEISETEVEEQGQAESQESTVEVDPRDERKFYSSFAFMQTEEDTEQFEKLRQEGKYDEMLFLASEHVQDSDIDLTYVKEHAHEFQGDDLVAENEELAVVYNGSVGGTYDLLRKVSENDIREKIDREGGLETFHLPDYPKAVWDIQRDMTAEEWKDGRKDNLPMPSGDVLHASYNRENDTLEVRDPKKGDEILASVKYFHRESMEKNLGNAYVGVTMSHPEYEERQVKDEISDVETVDKRKVADNNQVLKDIIEESVLEPTYPLHNVSNISDFKKVFAETDARDLESRFFVNPKDPDLSELKEMIAGATQKQLLAAGVASLPNYHYPHKEGRSYNSMISALSRIERLGSSQADNAHVQQRVRQATDIFNSYKRRVTDGMGTSEILGLSSPSNNTEIPRSHYSDGIRPIDLRERFRDYHLEKFDVHLPNGDVKQAVYNFDKDAYDIGQLDGMDFKLEDSLHIEVFDMDEELEVYRHLTGITKSRNLENARAYFSSKPQDESVVYTDGTKAKVDYKLHLDSLDVVRGSDDDEVVDARVPYDGRLSVEENLKILASELAYKGHDVKTFPTLLDDVKEKDEKANIKNEQKVAHEDSNIETNVAADAKRIAASGVPMEKAEKIAKAQADGMAHEEMHRDEAEQALEKQKKMEMEHKEEEKKKQEQAKKSAQDRKYDMYATHAAILLGGLAAAEKNDGVWMNKGFRQSPSFLFSQKLAIEPYNEVLMGLAAEQNGFRTNVYTTFDDAKRNGIYVQAKQKSIPFSWVQWQYLNPNDEKDVLTPKQYEALDKKARQDYVLHANKRPINIFNVEQTTYPAMGKEAFTELLKIQGDQKEAVDIGRTANVYRSYSEMTDRHPTMIVLMREDDSFKCFKGCAKKVADALGVKPGMAEYKGEKVAYMEFPASKLEDYLPKLSNGNRVVICKKSEDPVIIKQLENSREILENAYSTARNVAKTDGMNFERVMVLQPARYDAKTNTFSVSGMSQPDTNDRTAAMEKASDIYRKLAMVTGLENRLDRSGRNNLTPIDDVKYDRLVQELAAGVLMARQGLPAVISKENRELIPYWEREIKENPKMMGIIERDIDTTLEVIDNLKEGRKPDYSKILGNAAPKHKLNRADYTAVKELNRLTDIEYKEFVVVKDPEKKAVSVILPAGASLEVDNEVPGMRKDRIATAIRKEGYEEVRFFNAGGSLGLKEPNEFFRGKEVSIVSLKGYDIEKQRDIDLSKHLEKNPVISLNAFRKPEGGWYFHIKAEGEKGFCVDPEKKYINSYFAAYKKGDKANFEAMKQELGRQFYKLAKVHEDVKRDYLMPRKVDVDYSRIRSAFISQSSKDPNTKMLTVNIDGERMFHQVSKDDYRKLWLAEDKVAYAKGLAAVAFEDYLKNGNKQQTELGFKEGQGQGQDVSQNEAKGQSEDDGADRGHSPEPKPASEVDERHKVGFHI